LSADEYRALVASLDDEPGGWRHCAMAFLESQALAGELSGVRRGMTLGDEGGNAPATAPADKGQAPPKRGPTSFRLTTFLAMAASFVVAFGLGIAAPRWFGGADGPTVAVSSNGSPTEIAAGTNSSNRPRYESFKPIGNVRLVVDGPSGDSTAVGDVPIYDLPVPMEQWLANERPALSPEVLQTLEDRGHSIERQVEYVPVLLDDGRQVIVPIERYQIRPATERPY
jgi:hypothetical protein